MQSPCPPSLLKLLTKGNKKLAIEYKVSSAPKVTKGFWSAVNDLSPDSVWIISPIEETYSIEKNVTISSLKNFIQFAQQDVTE